MGESSRRAPAAELPGHTRPAGSCLAGRRHGTARGATALLGTRRAVLGHPATAELCLGVLGWLWGRQGQGEAMHGVCEMGAGTHRRTAGLEQSN